MGKRRGEIDEGEKRDKAEFAPVTRSTFLVMLGCRSESIARANVSEMGIVFNML